MTKISVGLKEWGFRMLLVLCAGAVTLVAAECIIRFIPWPVPENDHAVWQPDSLLHHRLVPDGQWQHKQYEYDYIWANNSIGMRDRERPARKEDGHFRILLLGDSFIQGYGVPLEQTLGIRAETALNEPKRIRIVDVLNGGVWAYSPMLEYLYLRKNIDLLTPDLVILAVCLGNDVGDDHYYQGVARFSRGSDSIYFDDRSWSWTPTEQALDSLERPQGKGVQTHSSESHGGVWREVKQLLARSRVLVFTHDRLVRLWRGEPADTHYVARRMRQFELVKSRRGDIRYDRGLVNYPVLTADERKSYWNLSLGYIEKMNVLCRSRDAHFVLLIIPPLQRLIGETDFNEPYEVLETFGREHDISVINLLPDFVRENPYELYYRYDRHWTPLGHQRAAEIVVRELSRTSMLPELLK